MEKTYDIALTIVMAVLFIGIGLAIMSSSPGIPADNWCDDNGQRAAGPGPSYHNCALIGHQLPSGAP